MVRGLSHIDFLTNGKFYFSEGKPKIDDDIFFLFSFSGERIYLPDFGQDFSFLIQKTSSFFFQYRALFLGQLRAKMLTQLPQEVSVESLTANLYRGTRDIAITVEYTSEEDPLSINETILFL